MKCIRIVDMKLGRHFVLRCVEPENEDHRLQSEPPVLGDAPEWAFVGGV